MNLLSRFATLKPITKIAVVVCSTVLLLVFMYLTYETGMFDDIILHFLEFDAKD